MGSFQDELAAKLSVIEDLPTLPAIIMELERMLHNDTVSAAEVGVVIEEDPAIAASVLRVANSVMFYSSASGTIVSIRDAIVRLGFREVHQVVSAAAFIRAFGKMARRVDPQHFWKRSLTTAVAGRVIANAMTQSVSFFEDDAYVAGLLHDIGLLLLDQCFAEAYDQVEAAMGSQNASWADTEREVLGLDHGQIGGLLLENWNLPETIVQAVTWHNRPANATPDTQITAEGIQVAEQVAELLDAEEVSEECMQTLLGHPFWAKLGIDEAGVTKVLEETRSQSNPVFALV
jgi:HD-like signal output (HDOD) protein